MIPTRKVYFVRFFPAENGEIVENDEPPVEYIKPYKNPPDALHPYTKFRMDIGASPRTIWRGKPRGRSRTAPRERLTSSDRGVILLREVMFREMKKVRQGQDPMGVVRDAANNPFIDTHLLESIAQIGDDRSPRAVNRVTLQPSSSIALRGARLFFFRVQSLLLGIFSTNAEFNRDYPPGFPRARSNS